jgi:hypothetical protein
MVARAGIEPSLTDLKDLPPLQKRNARVGADWIEQSTSNMSGSRCYH